MNTFILFIACLLFVHHSIQEEYLACKGVIIIPEGHIECSNIKNQHVIQIQKTRRIFVNRRSRPEYQQENERNEARETKTPEGNTQNRDRKSERRGSVDRDYPVILAYPINYSSYPGFQDYRYPLYPSYPKRSRPQPRTKTANQKSMLSKNKPKSSSKSKPTIDIQYSRYPKNKLHKNKQKQSTKSRPTRTKTPRQRESRGTKGDSGYKGYSGSLGHPSNQKQKLPKDLEKQSEKKPLGFLMWW